MIVVDMGSKDPYFNFAVEDYFLTEKPQKETVFLFWQTRPTVMLGRFQNAYQELNLAAVERDGVQVVRRQTGGGTIYTDEGGWQFSFILPQKAEQIDFGQFLDPIVQALAALGVHASYNSRNDLEIDGKKISGNAQCGRGDYTLHHGSLLYATDLSKMATYLNVPAHKLKSKGIRSVKSRTTNISEQLDEPWSSEGFAQKMIAEVLKAGSQRYALTAEDRSKIEQIADKKWRSWDWNFGKNPSFSIQHKGHFAGGLLEIALEVEHGKIKACQFSGDFFSAQGLEGFVAELIGLPYERGAIERLLRAYPDLIYRIGSEEILATFFR